MRQKSYDLFAVNVLAILSAVLAMMMPDNSIVRLICALPLVFFLPGYAITSAILLPDSLGNAERLLFSLGISVSVTALSGLALNLTTWGLQTNTWAIALALIVLTASTIAWLRHRQDATTTVAPIERHFKLSFRNGLFMGLAILVTCTAIGLTRLPVEPNGVEGYTLLWMTPVTKGNINVFHLGLTSAEFTETRYRLQVSVSDQVVQDWTELSVKPGETWETVVRLQSDQVGSGSIEANLYKLEDPKTIYRHVELWRGESRSQTTEIWVYESY